MDEAGSHRAKRMPIHVENLASIRVAEKLDYTPFGECAYRGYPAITFQRLRP